MRPALALLASITACNAPPTVSVLVVRGEGVPAISKLARLRLIVRSCDSPQPSIAENLPLTSPPSIEGPIVPGTSFYLWLQGWEACNPPCVPENPTEPNPDPCTCFANETPIEQRLGYEACTNWRDADTDIRLTLTLSPKAGLCPPAPLPATDCKTP